MQICPGSLSGSFVLTACYKLVKYFLIKLLIFPIIQKGVLMKVAMIVCSNTPEVIWNAFRLGNMMLEGMEDVAIFLNGPSVEYEKLASEKFPLNELAKIFTLSEGNLFA